MKRFLVGGLAVIFAGVAFADTETVLHVGDVAPEDQRQPKTDQD